MNFITDALHLHAAEELDSEASLVLCYQTKSQPEAIISVCLDNPGYLQVSAFLYLYVS